MVRINVNGQGERFAGIEIHVNEKQHRKALIYNLVSIAISMGMPVSYQHPGSIKVK